MRAWVLAAALAIMPGQVLAQATAPYPSMSLPPLGPFSFGMSTQAAHAAALGVEWDIIDDETLQRGAMRSRSSAVEMHGVGFRVALAYAANAVTLIYLTADLPLSVEGCAAQFRTFVEAEMPIRGPFSGREYWHRFYADPDGPQGRWEGDMFTPAPSIAVRGTHTTLRNPNVQFDSDFMSYDGAEYGQAYHSATNSHYEISALSIARGAEPSCRVAVKAINRRAGGGFRLSDGSSGPQRLDERLAAAELVPPVAYLDRPDPWQMQRHYPSAAFDQSVGGDVKLNCLVLADGHLDCAVAEEAPLNLGFGDAALRISRGFRADVFTDVVGKRTEVPIRFRLAE